MQAQVFDTPESIAFYQLCARRSALRLELLGMKRHGRSCYSICKEVYALKGSKAAVLAQLETMIAAALAAKESK